MIYRKRLGILQDTVSFIVHNPEVCTTRQRTSKIPGVDVDWFEVLESTVESSVRC